jgi:hypothetical protein
MLGTEVSQAEQAWMMNVCSRAACKCRIVSSASDVRSWGFGQMLLLHFSYGK